jgi:hypothetical protein
MVRKVFMIDVERQSKIRCPVGDYGSGLNLRPSTQRMPDLAAKLIDLWVFDEAAEKSVCHSDSGGPKER